MFVALTGTRQEGRLDVMTRFAVVLGLLAVAVAVFGPGTPRAASLAALVLAIAILGANGWRSIRERRRRRTLAGLRDLTPADFEAEVARWLRRDGWAVEPRGGTGDGGIDLLARHRQATLAVQCKRYGEATAVTSAQVRDLYGAALAVEATAAALVTTGRVSAPALAWAEALPAGMPLAFHDFRCLPRLAEGSARV